MLLSRLSSRHGGCCSGFVLRGVVKASDWLGSGQLAAAGFAFRLLTRNSVAVCVTRLLPLRSFWSLLLVARLLPLPEAIARRLQNAENYQGVRSFPATHGENAFPSRAKNLLAPLPPP